mmetsp:Transcript_36624/g.57180  ORF Transcript_36624/g.57180 Transcript_36624/m.57180 type:complete len:563 (-) Transcript_36624:1138-2826(-)
MISPQTLVFSRWAAMGSCLFAASVAATAYAFGVYSEGLQDALGFSQGEIDYIASVGETGLYLAVFCGVFMGYVGPRITIIVGAALVFLGFQYLYLATTNSVVSSVNSVAGMLLVAQLGTACISVSTLAVCIRNFPAKDRGKAAGIVKAYFGISSSILAQLYTGFFDGDATNFLRFLSMYIPAVFLVSVVQVAVLPTSLASSYAYEQSQGLPTGLEPWFGHLLVLVVYLLVVGGVEDFTAIGQKFYTWTAVGVLVLQGTVLLLAWYYGPLVPPRGPAAAAAGGLSKQARQRADEGDLAPIDFAGEPPGPLETGENQGSLPRRESTEQDALLGCFRSNGNENYGHLKDQLWGHGSAEELSGESRGCAADEHVDNLTILQALQTTRFWVLYTMFFCGAGTGLVVINNVPQIAESLGLSTSAYFVSLIGIFNCIGRAVAGLFSDRVRDAVGRPTLLCAALGCLGLTAFLFAAGRPALAYPCFVLTGFFYGALFSLMSALAADAFGPAHVAANYGALDLAPACGSFFFATYVVGLFYDDGGGGGSSSSSSSSAPGGQHSVRSPAPTS